MAIYDHYYSGSDVNIYLRYVPSGRMVHLDKAIGIGFNHSMSTIPIYTLGNVNPSFFSRGNSLLQGSLDIVFKSDQYLQKTINHLINQKELNDEKEELEYLYNTTYDYNPSERLADINSYNIIYNTINNEKKINPRIKDLIKYEYESLKLIGYKDVGSIIECPSYL
mgnify:CR=1 FL=1